MIKNKKLSEEKFHKTREKVLAQWETGSAKALKLENAIERLKSIPEEKDFASVLKRAKEEGVTLTQPRAGVALIDQHIELLRFLADHGEADLLPSTIDSYTRQNRYSLAADAIKQSKKQKRSLLNGFPAVNHGAEACYEVLQAVSRPVQARHGTPDARLLSEIIHAGGWTSNEGGGISYNIPYAKSISLEDTLRYWQYIDRLVGLYAEAGVIINREPFGPLTGTLVPPSITHTVAIIEALLAAEQGVKSITVGYGQCGNIVQDVAALETLESLTTYYLKLFGYEDVHVTTVFHQWMGGFPKDESKAMGIISLASAVASLGGATKMITKSPHESEGIPTKEANAEGLRASKMVTGLLREQRQPPSNALEAEKNLIKQEVNALLYATLNIGKGDLAEGTVKAFKAGVLDVPFAPSQINAGKVLPARDAKGNIRILEFGNLPFNDEIKTYHRDALENRADQESRQVDFQMTIDDIYAVSRGRLVGASIATQNKKEHPTP